MKVNSVLRFASPSLIYALIIAVPYAFIMEQQFITDIVLPIETYFFRALSLIVPFLIMTLFTKVINNLLLFIPLVIALVIAFHFVWNEPLITAVCGMVILMKYLSRVRKVTCIYDNVYIANCFIFLFYFILSGFIDAQFIQLVSGVSLFINIVVLFSTKGFERFWGYAEINQKMKNAPTEKIVFIGSNIITFILLALLFVGVPLIWNNFEYMKFELPQFDSVEFEGEVYELNQSSNGGGFNPDALGLGEASEPWLFWIILDYLTRISLVVGVVYFFIRMMYSLIKNFKKEKVEGVDLIQSTFNDEEADGKTPKKKADKIKFFDFSPNAVIRRKYKNTVKNKKSEMPHNWQSPQEIEKFVGINAPVLHDLYEKARYSEKGCSKEDLKMKL